MNGHYFFPFSLVAPRFLDGEATATINVNLFVMCHRGGGGMALLGECEGGECVLGECVGSVLRVCLDSRHTLATHFQHTILTHT